MRCFLWALLMLMPALAPVHAANASRWWGVVVGVGHYEHLHDLDLDGPPQDVPLVVNWLRHQAVPRRQLTVLADQIPSADGLPTRAAILEALNRLPARMQRGDVAFIYLAGHGSQQPQGGRNWSKTDGMDEIFLPRDVGEWDGSTGMVQGALRGADFGEAIEALRARGVFVWLVVDSCHSATLARAARIPRLRLRAVPPEALHEPPPRGASAEEPRFVQLQGKERAGGYVAFYAAQTDETAPEMPLPAGELNNSVHGLFTFSLLQALSVMRGGSYRDLAHRILAYYSATFPATTPEFEGALDGPLGSPESPLLTPGTWPATNQGSAFKIDAGRLNGVTAGSLLALHSSIQAGPPQALLEVQRASLTEAYAKALAAPDALKQWKISADHSGAVASGTVTILTSGTDLVVRIARPVSCPPGEGAAAGCPGHATPTDTVALDKARALLRQSELLPAGAELIDQSGSADLFLWVRDRRLYVLRASATPLDLTASIDLDAADAAVNLAELMRRAVRAAALLKLSREFPEEQRQLDVALQVREPDGRFRDDRLDAVAFGSELSLQIRNVASADLNVTVLSVSDNWAIVPVYPVDQESNVLRRGSARLAIQGWARSHGDTALVFIVEENRAGHPHDLGYLAQPGIARARSDEGLGALLAQAGFSPRGTRGGLTSDERSAASMRTLHYFVTELR